MNKGIDQLQQCQETSFVPLTSIMQCLIKALLSDIEFQTLLKQKTAEEGSIQDQTITRTISEVYHSIWAAFLDVQKTFETSISIIYSTIFPEIFRVETIVHRIPF